MIRLALIVMAFCATLMPAHAFEEMSAVEAWAMMQDEKMVLVDVRQPQEWKATGIAPGAGPSALREPAFLEKLGQTIAANPGKTVGLICAAGGRSTFVARELEKRGMDNVVDLGEGMIGTWRKKGWVRSGLPVTPWQAP